MSLDTDVYTGNGDLRDMDRAEVWARPVPINGPDVPTPVVVEETPLAEGVVGLLNSNGDTIYLQLVQKGGGDYVDLRVCRRDGSSVPGGNLASIDRNGIMKYVGVAANIGIRLNEDRTIYVSRSKEDEISVFPVDSANGKYVAVRNSVYGLELQACDKEGKLMSGGHIMNLDERGVSMKSGMAKDAGYDLDGKGRVVVRFIDDTMVRGKVDRKD